MNEAATYADSLLGQQAYEEHVERLLQIKMSRARLRWEIGDIVLAVIGPPGTGKIGIQKLADRTGLTVSYLNNARATSDFFPADQRDSEIPWSVYNAARSLGPGVAEEIVARYGARRRSEAGAAGRTDSKTLYDEVVTSVLTERGIRKRSVSGTATRRLAYSINRWLREYQAGRLNNTLNVTELQVLRGSAGELLDILEGIKGL